MDLKHVFVLGYPNNNLGDDLFFKILLERYPGTQFIFNNAAKSKILTKYPNAVEDNLHGIKKLKSLTKIDMFLLIGGSMFQEVVPKRVWLKGTIHLIIELVMLKFLKKKIIFIGFNFGPYKTNLFLFMNRIVFSLVDYLSVRDKKTFELLKKNKKLHFFPDIVFGLNDKKFINRNKTKSIAVSVMDFGPNVNFQQKYEDFLVNILKPLKGKIKINLFGFQHSDEIDDLVVAKRIRKRLNESDISVVQYSGSNMDEFLKEYYENEFAISSRFHSLVLSLKAGQKIISINYNVKVENLKETFNLKNTYVNPIEFKNMRRVNQIIDEINSWITDEKKEKEYYMNIKIAKRESEKHFSLLDKFLI